ncbi:MAG: AAA family ATPase [Bdellovibrionota bacterium]
MDTEKNLEVYEANIALMMNRGDFNERTKQIQFCNLMRDLIVEVIKKPFNKNTITGLIQVGKFYSSDECIHKYVQLFEIEDPEYFIKNMTSIEINFRGLTGAGKRAVSVDEVGRSNLEKVRSFLISVSEAKSYEEAKEAVKKFTDLNIPVVKHGIFSTWLIYLQPYFCPILNNMGSSLYESLGWDGESYLSFMEFAHNKLSECVEGRNLLYIDASSWPHLLPGLLPHVLIWGKTSFQLETGIANFNKTFASVESKLWSECESWIFGATSCLVAPVDFCGYQNLSWDKYREHYLKDSIAIPSKKLVQKKNFNLTEITSGEVFAVWNNWMLNQGLKIEGRRLFGSEIEVSNRTSVEKLPLLAYRSLSMSNLSPMANQLIQTLFEMGAIATNWEEVFEEEFIPLDMLLSKWKSTNNNFQDLLGALEELRIAGLLGMTDENEKKLSPQKLQQVTESQFFNQNVYFEKGFSDLFELNALHPLISNFQPVLTGVKSMAVTTKTDFKLNTIFCGPPGTGKTYHSIFRALDILGVIVPGGRGSDEFRAAAIKAFEDQIKKGNILFLTFNQAYSYEEFIEGIRPILNKDQLSYKLEDGALKKFLFGGSQIKDLFSAGDVLKATRSKFVVDKVDNGNIKLRKFELSGEDSRGNIYIPLEALQELWQYMKNKNVTAEVLMSRDYLGNIKQDLETDNFVLGYTAEFTACLNHLKSKELDIRDNTKAKVLVIDEINRGNVSQIFGELITLLEEDKREGKGVTIKLPYSKESFILPPNLYVLGTMNTADKSIAPLDFALRRRFHFESYWPDSRLVSDKWKVEGITREQARVSFESLNEKIEMLRGRDYTIGHSYFLKTHSPEDLYRTIFEQIIPLLNEYFYQDWKSLGFILGKGFVRQHPGMKKFKGVSNLLDECWVINDFVEYGNINMSAFLKAFSDLGKMEDSDDSQETA